VLVFYFLFFVFGLCVGSFLNVVIYRLPRGISLLRPRSFCPKCKKKIAWFDNIPLFSFALLKGRCRSCRSPISWRYPLVELITGVLFVLALGKLGELGVLDLVLTLILFSAMIAIFFIDLEHRLIPDQILFPLIFLFFIRSLLSADYWLLVAGLGAALFLFLIFALTGGRGMGLGDVKLAFLMGLVLGFPKIIVAFYIAFLTGAFIGIILILVKKARFGQQIAFGPFLAFSTLVALLWGEKILKLAQNFLF